MASTLNLDTRLVERTLTDKGPLQASTPTLYTGKWPHTDKEPIKTRSPYARGPYRQQAHADNEPHRQVAPTDAVQFLQTSMDPTRLHDIQTRGPYRKGG